MIVQASGGVFERSTEHNLRSTRKRVASCAMDVSLRRVIDQDVSAFWVNQQDIRPQEGTPAHQECFAARWRSVLNDRNAPIRTIVVGGQAVGYIAHFRRKGLPEVSYELGRPHWGKGYATAALHQFLSELAVRPLYARAAKDNAASIRVLHKCGFVNVAEDRFTDATGNERDEFIFELR